MTSISAKFSRAEMESLSKEDRVQRLSELAQLLNEKLRNNGVRNSYWRGSEAVIEELRQLNHDLWSHDFDGDKSIWGWDYSRMATAGFLEIEFDFLGTISCGWRDS